MPLVHIRLAIEIFLSLMIGVYNKFVVGEIVTLMLDGLNNSMVCILNSL